MAPSLPLLAWKPNKSGRPKRAPRPRKPPPPSEFKCCCALADMVRRWCNPGWFWTHLPLGENRTQAAGERLKRMGTQPGWFDYQFISPAGIPHFLEMKRRGGTLSLAQQDFAEHCQASGVAHAVTDNVPEAVAQLIAWGVLPASVHVQ